jgi:hypothetical protein
MSITSKAARDFTFVVKTTPENIGPGMYDPGASTPTYKAAIPFGRTVRRELWRNLPTTVGPGQYNPKPVLRAVSGLTPFALSSDRRYFEDKEGVPSPARYSQLAAWGSDRLRPVGRRSTTIQPREAFPLRDRLPGPSDYTPIIPRSNRSAPFAASRVPQREPVYYDGVPGPGAYAISRAICASAEVPAERDSSVFRSGEVRDAYDMHEDDEYDATMLGHSAWRAETPTKRPFGGRSPRILSYPGGDPETPAEIGPGRYTPKAPSEPKMLRSSFGTERELVAGNLPMGHPGPGFYVPAARAGVTAASMPHVGRPPLWQGMVRVSPSPGQYEPHVREAMDRRALLRVPNPAFRASGDRDCLTNTQPNPGPAAYYARPARGTGGVKQFARGPRFTDRNFVGPAPLDENPGPGSYTIEPLLLKHHSAAAMVQTRASMKCRKVGKGQMFDRPGIPNSQIPARTLATGGFIGKATRFAKLGQSDTPGPDHYQDPLKCELIHPSANIAFDPSRQPLQKFEGV